MLGIGADLAKALTGSTYSAATIENTIDPNRPLLQLDLDGQYFDPQRVERTTGLPLAVGAAPYVGGATYDFLVKTDDGTGALRNFGQGVVMKIKYIKAYYTNLGKVVPQFPSTTR